MTKAIEDMTGEELEAFMYEKLMDRHRGESERFRLQFELAGVKCFTEPMSLEKIVELYYGYPQSEMYKDFMDALGQGGAFDGSPLEGDGPWPVVQYEYIEGKVWRDSGREYSV